MPLFKGGGKYVPPLEMRCSVFIPESEVLIMLKERTMPARTSNKCECVYFR